MRIEFTHSNGYTGILYGKSSYIIKKDGREILHTGRRTINTLDDLIDHLGTVPELIELLEGAKHGKENRKIL